MLNTKYNNCKNLNNLVSEGVLTYNKYNSREVYTGNGLYTHLQITSAKNCGKKVWKVWYRNTFIVWGVSKAKAFKATLALIQNFDNLATWDYSYLQK